MKKFLILLVAIMCLNITQIAKADEVAQMGFSILEANNIQKRLVFKTTPQIKNPRATLDYRPDTTRLDYTGRVIWIYGDTLSLIESKDELAGILSYSIAMGENSYKGMFRGFFSHFAYTSNPKGKANKADLKAVDYMVKAGYNPIGLITIYNKTLAQTRYEWCHYYPLATKRMTNIYGYISKKYPQFLENNTYANNIYYKNFLSTTGKEMRKLNK